MAVRENGLFTKVDRPLAGTAMGSCYVSHKATAGVDTGCLIEFEGTLFLCNEVIRELAEVAGFSVNEEGLQLEHDLAFAQHRIAELTAENAKLREDLDLVSVVFARGQAKK